MPVLRDIGMLATCRFAGGQGAIHTCQGAALAWKGTRILWAGRDADLPSRYLRLNSIRDAEGRLVIPGLIDCHTHLAFGGWRADEFEQRILGRPYTEIARAGGGILKTVAATREASNATILARCRSWLAAMAALGVTTVEAKTGYGLTVEAELRLLRIYRALQQRRAPRLIPTLLAAHAVPPEYKNKRSAYLQLICRRLIPAAAGQRLARFCDVFVEETAFSREEAKRILQTARKHGLGLKVHADQLTDGGGAALAAELKAISADHLDCISDTGIAALRKSGTVAVSLPLATLYLGRPPMPARRLIEAGIPVAVATDFNPGTAPSFHLPLALLLACTLQRMTPSEALKGATIYAARAVGEEQSAGSIEAGKRADFAIIDAPDVNQWLYHFAPSRCVATYIAGQRVLAPASAPCIQITPA